MTFTELLTAAKELSLPDQIRLASELLQSIDTHWFSSNPIPPTPLPQHPLQNLTPPEYDHHLTQVFQSWQTIAHDRELTTIFEEIDRQRHLDLGRNFPEWES
ncbi:hypothetical protein [Prochlorothrix hollandica]|uniref:Uncharacterized protein n=1 Tax=Prochlorothrix hollandica PCC 9006 = CALU 1027 TaxID=317619 RepID=A0A0M2PY75_PROHO|nr:hypothetical protein [Prochlorothrix hollandica]KKJ00033.1 hypothetical protein PROH_09685 [Prochlorothrix hollandica PCC 9006 = CALU 1027]